MTLDKEPGMQLRHRNHPAEPPRLEEGGTRTATGSAWGGDSQCVSVTNVLQQPLSEGQPQLAATVSHDFTC